MKKRSCNYHPSAGKIFDKIQDVFLVKNNFQTRSKRLSS